MNNSAPMPSEVAARAGEAIRSLTAVQIADIMTSSQRLQKRVLPICWEVVATADPALAQALDELHETSAVEDLPRFDVLAAQHAQAMARAVKLPAGRTIAGLIIGSLIVGTLTLLAWLAGSAGPAVNAWAVLAAVMLGAGIQTGRHLAARTGNWMLANAELAAATVWDAGIDAAAATALDSRVGTAGLTPDVLRALACVWTGAGLDTALLIPEPAVAEPVATKPAVKRSPSALKTTAPKTAAPKTAAPAAKRLPVKRVPKAAQAVAAVTDPANVPVVKVPAAA